MSIRCSRAAGARCCRSSLKPATRRCLRYRGRRELPRFDPTWLSLAAVPEDDFVAEPFEMLSIQLNEFDTIIVLDGGGYSKGAEFWLKGQVGKNELLHVFNLGGISRFHSQGRL